MNPKLQLMKTINANYKMLNKYTDTEVSFTKSNKTLYIDFQGSKSKKDWIYNFKMFTTPFLKINVHQGLYIKWHSVRTDIFEKVRQLRDEITKIVFRGFSQGGGVATIGYYEFKTLDSVKKLGLNIECIIFGAPAVFGDIKDTYVFRDLKNYVISNDFVTWNFPGFLGYRRFGSWIEINKNWPWYKKIFPCFKCHYPANYLELL
jgi:hypothetical protein